MNIIAGLVVALVALLHMYFLALEMFQWDKPAGMRAFGTTQEFATASKRLAANQGLYNGFLVAGIVWAQFFAPANAQSSATLLFLGFVIAAAVWGAITSSKGILLKQGLPALLAFAATAAYVFQANA